MRPLLMVPVLCLAMAVVADAAPKKLIPPPMGEDISVRVMRGGSVEISLKAYEGRGNPLAYEIGRQPSHGQLESFQQAENNRQGFASVVYVHDDGEKSIKDEFTFRARMLAGGGLSSPIKVKVMIVDAPGRLGIPTVVDFSAVAGETDRQEIILTNEGGGLLEGRISPKEPFDVEGDGRFSLGRGQSTVLAVRFSPQSTAQVAPQKLSPSPSDPGAAITLKAEAKKPFSATAGTVVIGADGSRAGTITVTNLSSARLELEITTEPENAADVPRSTNIAKGASAGIPVTIAADKKGGALDLGVQISNPFYEEEIEVPVPAVPPKLEVATPELDFRKNKEAELRVTNSGGVVGRFSLELPKGWPTPEGAESFSVAPGSEKAVLLRRPEKAKATSDDKLFVDFGQDRKFPVHLALPASTPPPMT
ncbi:MAG: hypothetical protein JHD33_11005, partial [Chthoniobacterales bacterium]|nr:hypothetical protein [Chthoniobacterales bacterium]